MKVENITSPRSGKAVANQFSIYHDGVNYFQSYNSLCAKYSNGVLTLGLHWDYSITTLKYLYEWLDSECTSVARELRSSSNKRKKLQSMIDEGLIMYDDNMR